MMLETEDQARAFVAGLAGDLVIRLYVPVARLGEVQLAE